MAGGFQAGDVHALGGFGEWVAVGERVGDRVLRHHLVSCVPVSHPEVAAGILVEAGYQLLGLLENLVGFADVAYTQDFAECLHIVDIRVGWGGSGLCRLVFFGMVIVYPELFSPIAGDDAILGIHDADDVQIVVGQGDAVKAISALISCQSVLGAHPHLALLVAVQHVDVVIGQCGGVVDAMRELYVSLAVEHIDACRRAYPDEFPLVLRDGSDVERREHVVLGLLGRHGSELPLRVGTVGIEEVDSCESAECGEGQKWEKDFPHGCLSWKGE